jgi:tRNA 2-selenouridine synthase
MPNAIELDQDLIKVLREARPLIDVRAPIEFAAGSIDGAVNLPILTDDERARVGTTYKNQGPEAAVALGHELVSGDIKAARVQAWQQFILKNPQTILYCFRGGLRSKTTQLWLRELGLEVPLITGGYKRVRNFYLQKIEEVQAHPSWLVISGPTGSGKTRLIDNLLRLRPSLNLEALARHRGSAFGGYVDPQPSQADFENRLASQLLKLEERIVAEKVFFIEDESRMIGGIHQPLSVFEKLRESEVIWIEDPIETRVQRIYEEYVVRAAKESSISEVEVRLSRALQAISKKLGSEKTKELQTLITLGFKYNEIIETPHKDWIRELLVRYYDPLYHRSLERRQVKVAFKGLFEQALSYAKAYQYKG